MIIMLLSFCKRLQQTVPLLQGFIIIHQALQIFCIKLAKQSINKSSSFFAAISNNLHIIGCNDNTWKFSNVCRKFLIQLFIPEKFFLPCFAQNANCLFPLFIQFKFSLNPETLRTIMNILRIRFCEITFSETEIINRIQQVGFANAIVPTNADYSFIKRKR